MAQIVLHIDVDGLSTSSLASTPSPTASCSSSYIPTVSKQQRGLAVTFQDVAYSVASSHGQNTTILRGITGFFEPGEMTAVMGPSGSGKTTLLDVLAGRKTSGTMCGEVSFGGLPPSPALLRRATGYVEQFDTLVDSLTCQEMLLYIAQLKRPRTEHLAAKQAAVEALLDKLCLSGCANTRIGSCLQRGISGGQAKRLNIGIALITDPRVLFLDEPTSGLDSFTANEVMRVVSSLAREGTTIATTIHSPSSYCFGLFDKLLVLMSGRLVYFGQPESAAISYFTSSCGARQPRVGDNLAEWMLEAVTQAERHERKASLAHTYRKSSQAKANQEQLNSLLANQVRRRTRSPTLQSLQQLIAAEKQAVHTSADQQQCDLDTACCSCCSSGSGGFLDCGAYVTPAWWSLKVLLQYRTGRNYRTPTYVLPRLLEKLLFAVVVLSLYWGKGTDFSTLNIPVLSSLLFLMVLAPMCAAMIYLPTMCTERALYIRERNDGLYRPLTYLMFKLLDELLMMGPVTAGTSAAVFYACKLQGSWLVFWLVHYATMANGTALAYFLASICPGLVVAMPMLSFVLVLGVIMCGFMIRVAAMPLYWSWAVRINVVHYAWGALMINQYQGHTNTKLGGVNVLAYFGFADADPQTYLGIIVGMFFGWSFLAWLALAYARNHRR